MKGRHEGLNNSFRYLSSSRIRRFYSLFYDYPKCRASTNDCVSGMTTAAREMGLKMSVFWKHHWNLQKCRWEGNGSHHFRKRSGPIPRRHSHTARQPASSALDTHAQENISTCIAGDTHVNVHDSKIGKRPKCSSKGEKVGKLNYYTTVNECRGILI